MKLQFEHINPLDKQRAEQAFASADTEKIVQALLGTTYHEPDWEWVESRCLQYLESAVPDLRNTAILCLGHLARIHRQLHKAKVIQALSKYLTDPDYTGRIEDAMDDIEMFVK
jgi:hypothetical protein